jgi:hypothetical protein
MSCAHARLPQRNDLAFLLLGNEWPMVAGYIGGDQQLRFSTFRIVNP